MEYICRMGTLNNEGVMSYKQLPPGLIAIRDESWCPCQRAIASKSDYQKGPWTHIWFEPIEGFDIVIVEPGPLLPDRSKTCRIKLLSLDDGKTLYSDVPEKADLYATLNIKLKTAQSE
jgi:hypothetical protein